MKLFLKSMVLAFAAEFVIGLATDVWYYVLGLSGNIFILQEPGISLDHRIFSHFGRSTIPRDFAVIFGVQWLIYTLLIFGVISVARALKRRRVLSPNESAPPNGGPAAPPADSGVAEGPPSAS
jgi:hypothetical protein